MDDADPPFLGQGDGQTPFRHGIHGGGKERQVEGDVAVSLVARLTSREDLRGAGTSSTSSKVRAFAAVAWPLIQGHKWILYSIDNFLPPAMNRFFPVVLGIASP